MAAIVVIAGMNEQYSDKSGFADVSDGLGCSYSNLNHVAAVSGDFAAPLLSLSAFSGVDTLTGEPTVGLPCSVSACGSLGSKDENMADFSQGPEYPLDQEQSPLPHETPQEQEDALDKEIDLAFESLGWSSPSSSLALSLERTDIRSLNLQDYGLHQMGYGFYLDCPFSPSYVPDSVCSDDTQNEMDMEIDEALSEFDRSMSSEFVPDWHEEGMRTRYELEMRTRNDILRDTFKALLDGSMDIPQLQSESSPDTSLASVQMDTKV
jgi:hypothetical protein